MHNHLLDFISNIFGGVDVYDVHGRHILHSQHNILDGQNYYNDNSFIGHSQHNIFGGNSYFDAGGTLQLSSHPNVFGGVDIQDAFGEMIGHTEPNIFGGVNIHDHTGKIIGQTIVSQDTKDFHAEFFK